ncbi:hypothetical protein NMY22_g11698 [Coprinellus aureogranulatus]|nr:hypothetical protein NMY22_g11698 [Coprinellus aureogranulatus]
MSTTVTVEAGERYLIIGGAGFLGSHIVEALLARNEKSVTVYDLNLPPDGDAFDGVTYVQGDILDEDHLVDVLQKGQITTVFHTVSPIHGLKKELYYRVNIEGTKTILSACHKVNTVTALVFTSSTGAVWDGSPVNGATEDEMTYLKDDKFDAYGYTKGRAEELVLKADGENGVRTVAVRPCGMFGPRDNQGMWQIAAALETGQYIYKVGKEDKLSDMTYVGNVADAHLLAADKISQRSPDRDKVAGEAFFVNGGEPILYRTYPMTTWKIMGAEEKNVVIPLWVAWIMAFLGELYAKWSGKKLPLNMYSVKVMSTNQWYNTDKVRGSHLSLTV